MAGMVSQDPAELQPWSLHLSRLAMGRTLVSAMHGMLAPCQESGLNFLRIKTTLREISSSHSPKPNPGMEVSSHKSNRTSPSAPGINISGTQLLLWAYALSLYIHTHIYKLWIIFNIIFITGMKGSPQIGCTFIEQHANWSVGWVINMQNLIIWKWFVSSITILILCNFLSCLNSLARATSTILRITVSRPPCLVSLFKKKSF